MNTRLPRDDETEGVPLGADNAAGGSHRVVGIAASLGGIQALTLVLKALPTDFPLPVLIVQHLRRGAPSILPEILARRTTLRVKSAVEGGRPLPGGVYVAPPDRHLLVRADGRFGLSSSAPVNFCRPSADALFRSMAETLGARAIAVVLTGLGRDGARGMEAIVRAGGAAIAQDETTAEAPDMPRAAVDIGHADLILPLNRIAFALTVLADQPSLAVDEG
ncbi:chemotaxis protein CheB [Sabulicella rubraurantiaca]|uniref:chemotaxis protein CheB n=1 Tax=Sabulicella rubraurantiaca TaxID=2811429 RepID=UPI001A95E9C0|nr:chemotaxis protein CheB [Sabulicella rubraurantiaca]